MVAEVDASGQGKNVITLSHERGFSATLTVQEQCFWIVEEQVRVRTDLTTAEVDQLILLPTANHYRKSRLSAFGQKSSRDELLAWVACEIGLGRIPKEYRRPGNPLPIKSPIWTLCKGVLLAERRGEMESGTSVANHCHCLPRSAFCLYGCLCQSRNLGTEESVMPFLEVTTCCPTCSVCIRCLK